MFAVCAHGGMASVAAAEEDGEGGEDKARRADALCSIS